MEMPMVHPPHPEGASICAFGTLNHCVGARLEGWGGLWFETPYTRLRILDRSKSAAPHHEAGRDHVCIGNRALGRAA